jgi:SAM-dependent methyltransferase
MRYYDRENRRLVYLAERATSNFWNDRWANPDPEKTFAAPPAHRSLRHLTRRYLKPGSVVLEGGCGLCDKVFRLHEDGFAVVGIDFARETVSRVKRNWGHLGLVAGDVVSLPLKSESCDGYWSLGVIEHFYDGYTRILEEAKRVLRPGGILFLAFPHMSLLRKTKAALGMYPAISEPSARLDYFYQYVLASDSVIESSRRIGFEFLKKESHATLLEIKMEIPAARGVLKLLNESVSRIMTVLGLAIDKATFGRTGHSCLLVLRKRA